MLKALAFFVGVGKSVDPHIVEHICHPNETSFGNVSFDSWNSIFTVLHRNCGREASLDSFIYSDDMGPYFLGSCRWKYEEGNVVFREHEPNACNFVCVAWQINNAITRHAGKGCFHSDRRRLGGDQSIVTFDNLDVETRREIVEFMNRLYPDSDYTMMPTLSPTHFPTKPPTRFPTKTPTHSPTSFPTNTPTHSPTTFPTKTPSQSPTTSPTETPTYAAITFPPKTPTYYQTKSPKSVAPTTIHDPPNAFHPNQPTSFQNPRPTSQDIAPENPFSVVAIAVTSSAVAAFIIGFVIIIILRRSKSNEELHLHKQITEEPDENKYQTTGFSKTPTTAYRENIDNYWRGIGFLVQTSDTWVMFIDRETGNEFWVDTPTNQRFDSYADLIGLHGKSMI